MLWFLLPDFSREECWCWETSAQNTPRESRLKHCKRNQLQLCLDTLNSTYISLTRDSCEAVLTVNLQARSKPPEHSPWLFKSYQLTPRSGDELKSRGWFRGSVTDVRVGGHRHQSSLSVLCLHWHYLPR